MSDLRRFLDVLYGDCDGGVVECRALPSAQRAWARPGDWAALGPFLSAQVAARQNLYVGVATRRDTSSGATHNLLEATAVWLDFEQSRTALDAVLQRCPFPPRLIVGSGRGHHAYWTFKEPQALQAAADMSRFASILRRLAETLGGDLRATDPARILRLPDSYNFKYDEPRRVTLETVTEARVELSELDEWLPSAVIINNTWTVTGIPQGQRNDTLYRLARSLQCAGRSLPDIYRELEATNTQYCQPPLEAAELKRIAVWAVTQQSRPDFVPPVVIHDALPPPPAPVDEAIDREYRQQRIRREARRRLDSEDRGTVPEPTLRTLRERLATPPAAQTWRIQGWQPAQSRVMLAAQYKAGKTTLVGNLLRSLADGVPWLGVAAVTPVTGTVALLDTEMAERQLDEWHRALGIRRDDVVITEALRGRLPSLDLLDAARRTVWAGWLRDRHVEYLILDCLRPVMDAFGLDEHRDAGRILTAFDALLREAAVPDGLIVQHMGHASERSRGDSRLRDWPDVEWRLVRRSEDAASDRFIAAYGRDVDVSEGQLALDSTTRHLRMIGGSRQDERAATVVPDILAVLAESAVPLSGRAIKKALKESEHARDDIEAALQLGVRDSVLLATDGARNARLYARAVAAAECPVSGPIGTTGHSDTRGRNADAKPS